MGKVTVKHYINKRLSPLEKEGRLFYPLYVQITVNRKTTQIRSLLDWYLTDRGFDLFCDGVIDYSEQLDGIQQYYKTIAEEREFIQYSISFLEELRGEKYNLSDGRIREEIAMLATPAELFLSSAMRSASNQYKDDSYKICWLTNIINYTTPIWDIKRFIELATGLDITKHFSPYYLEYWEVMNDLNSITDLKKSYLLWSKEELPNLIDYPRKEILNQLLIFANNSLI